MYRAVETSGPVRSKALLLVDVGNIYFQRCRFATWLCMSLTRYDDANAEAIMLRNRSRVVIAHHWATRSRVLEVESDETSRCFTRRCYPDGVRRRRGEISSRSRHITSGTAIFTNDDTLWCNAVDAAATVHETSCQNLRME